MEELLEGITSAVALELDVVLEEVAPEVLVEGPAIEKLLKIGGALL